MTSFRQIDANRRNARKSTGPITEEGKHRSRRNAVRRGLTAETVIEVLEDPEDYKAFELSVIACFDAQTAVERELVLRLASPLWRLRRATPSRLVYSKSKAKSCVRSNRHGRLKRGPLIVPSMWLLGLAMDYPLDGHTPCRTIVEQITSHRGSVMARMIWAAPPNCPTAPMSRLDAVFCGSPISTMVRSID
jgi:hypothetical protein